MSLPLRAAEPRYDAVELAASASGCLHLEIDTYPKPGLVSHIDRGSHRDMDASLLHASAVTLQPFFSELARAGAAGAAMSRLRTIGLAAERAMLAATRGVNTYRGALFSLGLLVAAAGFRSAHRVYRPLGEIVARLWGPAILSAPVQPHSHGAQAARRYGARGARHQAAAGFPILYDVGLPRLMQGRRLAPQDDEAARVHCCFSLIAELQDTNLLHRGGRAGQTFAHRQARGFLAQGSIGRATWRRDAEVVHGAFIARNLSPGGSADMLAASLFALQLGESCWL